MSIQFSLLFCLCIALAIPLLVLSRSNQEIQEEIFNNVNNGLKRFEASNHQGQQPFHSLTDDDESNENQHFVLKKAADFEQILQPCNKMPTTGGGREYADCVRSRMLLMGRRKRRQAN